MDNVDLNTLAIVLDINPAAWLKQEKSQKGAIQLNELVDLVCLFVNAHLSMNQNARLILITTNPQKNDIVWSAESSNAGADRKSENYSVSSHHQQLRKIEGTIKTKIAASLESVASQYERVETSLVSGAISLALCQINRVTCAAKGSADCHSRICVFSATQDAPIQYVSMMNSIFAAQKMRVLIDVCRVLEGYSAFLQQAAYITKGLYSHPATKDDILMSIFYDFLPDAVHRQILNQPQQMHIDFRAACFCHKKIVDIGYVCSVCLSIFCKPTKVCSTCHTVLE